MMRKNGGKKKLGLEPILFTFRFFLKRYNGGAYNIFSPYNGL